MSLFLFPGEIFPDDLPDYWKPWVECFVKKNKGCDPSQDLPKALDSSVLQLLDGLSNPKRTSGEYPSYTPAAREASLCGVIKFFAVISKVGQIESLSITQPLGLGLDEAAAEALLQWTFEPVRSEGQPVSVAVPITVGFELR